MKIALIIIACLLLLIIVSLFLLGLMSHSGRATGLVEGKLARCPESRNCICSEFEMDTSHYVVPLEFSQGDAVKTLGKLKGIIAEMGGSIEAENSEYLAATFTSSVFRFVDDLEVRIDDDAKLIQLRSASRVGRGDGGVNRKRIERLKKIFQLKTS